MGKVCHNHMNQVTQMTQTVSIVFLLSHLGAWPVDAWENNYHGDKMEVIQGGSHIHLLSPNSPWLASLLNNV